MPNQPLALGGMRFGKLVAVERVANDRHGATRWRCICDCGRETVAVASDLKRGKWIACGCVRDSLIRYASVTHGASYTPEYRAVKNACERCERPNHKSYSGYGGRGIQFLLSHDYAEAAAEVVEAIGLRPSPDYSLDRVNNDGHYEVDNLRWATRSQQNRNRRPKLHADTH